MVKLSGKPYSFTGKKILFFDLNGTLVDQHASFRAAFQEALHEFIGRWHGETDMLNLEEIFSLYEAEWNKRKKHARLKGEEVQLSSLRQAVSQLPLETSDLFLQKLLQRIRDLQPGHVQLFPDAYEALSILSKKYMLAVISNGPTAAQLAKIHATGLSQFIPPHHLFTSHSEKSAKPHRTIFLNAMKKMDASAKQSVMIGDSWKRDICGALEAGMEAVWVKRIKNDDTNRPYEIKRIGQKPIPVVHSCKELLQFF